MEGEMKTNEDKRIREIAEANRLSIKLTKEIEHNMEVERETCDRSVDQ